MRLDKKLILIAASIAGALAPLCATSFAQHIAAKHPSSVPPHIGHGPADLTARAASPNAVELQWKPVNGATSFQVFRDQAQIASLAPSVTTYADKALQPATIYSYFVVALYPQGQALPAASSVVRTRTLEAVIHTGNKATIIRRPVRKPLPTLTQLGGHPPVRPPAAALRRRTKGAAPEDLDVEAISPNSVRLTWRALPGAAYQIVRDREKLLQQPTYATTYTDTELQPASTHSYRVIAIYSGSTSLPGVSPLAVITTPDVQNKLQIKVIPHSHRQNERTVLVAAFDSRTGAPVNGTVNINGAAGRTGSAIAYPTCSEPRTVVGNPFAPPHSVRKDVACHGTITAPGYPSISFEAPI